MKLPKIKDISPSGAIIFSGILISLSIFITGLMFLGNSGVKTNLPPRNTSAPTPLTPEQIKKIQEERAAAMQKRTAPATTTQSE
jgi:biopolymer transport protein ExbD